MFLVID